MRGELNSVKARAAAAHAQLESREEAYGTARAAATTAEEQVSGGRGH